jgi:hypothetical protein
MWQSLWVLFILPHDSAETSNAVWNLKDGALYGFFFLAVSGPNVCSVEVLLTSIQQSPCYSILLAVIRI